MATVLHSLKREGEGEGEGEAGHDQQKGEEKGGTSSASTWRGLERTEVDLSDRAYYIDVEHPNVQSRQVGVRHSEGHHYRDRLAETSE